MNKIKKQKKVHPTIDSYLLAYIRNHIIVNTILSLTYLILLRREKKVFYFVHCQNMCTYVYDCMHVLQCILFCVKSVRQHKTFTPLQPVSQTEMNP